MNASDARDTLSAVAEDLSDRLSRRLRPRDHTRARAGVGLLAMKGYIFQLNCSNGGVPKRPVSAAVLTETGLVGDRQKHTTFHGGSERALSLYALELIEQLQREGHPISPGSAGENVTVAGLDWSRLAPGTRLALGNDVVIEITSYAAPCATIRDSFAEGRFKRISQKVNPGASRLYARVLRAGRLAAGQEVCVLDSDDCEKGARPNGREEGATPSSLSADD